MNPVDHWDEQAARFDEAPDHGLTDPLIRTAWLRLLTPWLPDPPGRIADVGAGTGSLTLLLASHGHRVRGIDFSPRMVERAQAKAGAARVAATFCVGDARALPWPTGSVDVVLCRHVLWALPDPESALTEWLRVLAPSGRLLLIEGRWWTGAGMTAARVVELLAAHHREARVLPLTDPALWGGPISDERYLVSSPATAQSSAG